ncbi:MAG: radical SAM protein, partial [Armatimonadetes bacterium]|nr:radical SAM protein [Armatimonadota bacterium]
GFHWDITQACNFRCNFCLTNSGKAGPGELSLERKLDLIERLFRVGVLYLKILGGEPLVAPGALDVMRYAAARGLHLLLSTNGSRLSEAVVASLAAIRANIRYLQVSLYGATPAALARVAGSPRHFTAVQDGLRRLRDYDLRFTAMSVLCVETLVDVVPLYRLARRAGAQAFRLTLKTDSGRGCAPGSFRKATTDPEWRRLAGVLEALSGEQSDATPVSVQARPTFGEYLGREFGLAHYHSKCEAAIRYLYGDAAGNLAPCPFLANPNAHRAGDRLPVFPFNALRDDLLDVWHSPEFEQFRSLFRLSRNPMTFNRNCPRLGTEDCRPCVLSGCQCPAQIGTLRRARRSAA